MGATWSSPFSGQVDPGWKVWGIAFLITSGTWLHLVAWCWKKLHLVPPGGMMLIKPGGSGTPLSSPAGDLQLWSSPPSWTLLKLSNCDHIKVWSHKLTCWHLSGTRARVGSQGQDHQRSPKIAEKWPSFHLNLVSLWKILNAKCLNSQCLNIKWCLNMKISYYEFKSCFTNSMAPTKV